MMANEEKLLLTSSIECALEEAKAESSSILALEFALRKRTTFCMASTWEIYKALEVVTLFFKLMIA